jgi:hypothetical protein
VNSLEQLIDINQTLSGDVTSSTAESASSATGQAAGTMPTPATVGAMGPPQRTGASGATSSVLATRPVLAQASPANRVSGNLSVPAASAAAQRVGQALDGRTRAQQVSGSLADVR